jgi:hypothetical protein
MRSAKLPASGAASLLSLAHLWQHHQTLRRAALAQGLLSVSFSAFWSTLALMLSDRFHRHRQHRQQEHQGKRHHHQRGAILGDTRRADAVGAVRRWRRACCR